MLYWSKLEVLLDEPLTIIIEIINNLYKYDWPLKMSKKIHSLGKTKTNIELYEYGQARKKCLMLFKAKKKLYSIDSKN